MDRRDNQFEGGRHLNAADVIGWLSSEQPSITTISATLTASAPDEVAKIIEFWVDHSTSPEQLLTRGHADGWLWPAIEAVWAAPQDRPLAALAEESMLWMALSTLGGPHSGVSFAQSLRIQSLADNPRLHRGKVIEYRRRVLSAVVKAFQSPYVRERTVQFSGWLYLLTNASKEEFRAKNHAAALELAKEAWAFRKELPFALISSKAIVHVAVTIATAAAYIRDGDATQRLLDALACLDEAEILLDANPKEGVNGAVEYLSLAISRENILRRMSRWGIRPFLDCFEGGRDVLLAGLERFGQITALPPLERLAAGDPFVGLVPPSTYSTIVRALSRLAYCASRSGDWDLSAQAITVADRFPRGDFYDWEWAVTAALAPGNRAERQDRMERVLRCAEKSLGIPPRQRSALLERSAAAARDMSRALQSEKLFTNAWFWDRMSREWTLSSKGGRGVAAPLVSAPTPRAKQGAARRARVRSVVDEELVLVPSNGAGMFRAEPESTITGSQIAGLISRVRAGIPVPVILDMYRVGRQMNSSKSVIDLSGAAELIAIATAWTRPRRRMLEKPIPIDELDRGAIQLWLLNSASELAAVYAPNLLPEIHLTLSKSPYLNSPAKLHNARLCSSYARESGRPNFVSAGLFQGVTVALASGGFQGLSAQVDELIDAVREGSVWSGRGADIVETAYWAGRRIEKLIAVLLSANQAKLATKLFDASEGCFNRTFRRLPHFAAELQLMERASNGRTEKDQDELFRRMRSHVLAGELPSIDELHIVSAGREEFLAPNEVVVRLLAGTDSSWALMTSPDEVGVRHEAVRLHLGKEQIVALSDLVWYELRPTRSGKPVTALRKLHDAVIGPFLERIPPGSTILLHPQGVMSTLPLHAALGPQGYVIEKYAVAYYPTADSVPGSTSSRKGLVCGWDVSAQAEREARQVARVLRLRGYQIELPANAVDGRIRLLSSSDSLELVHVSGHGQSTSWPRSFESAIALSPRIQVTAGEWLISGPRAAFVFLNVCGVGRVKPFGGDLNGFPLALRIRGAEAVIAATGFIPPAEAHHFAEKFYRWAEEKDTLSAYQSTILESIEGGVAVGAWAPYAHFGRGYRFREPLPLGPRISRRPAGRNNRK